MVRIDVGPLGPSDEPSSKQMQVWGTLEHPNVVAGEEWWALVRQQLEVIYICARVESAGRF